MRATLSNVNVPKMDGIGLGTTHRVSTEELQKIEAYWLEAMIYLRDNPLLREPLKPEHIKKRLLGPLGLQYGIEFCLGSPESRNQEIRSQEQRGTFTSKMRPRTFSPQLKPFCAAIALSATGLHTDEPKRLKVQFNTLSA